MFFALWFLEWKKYQNTNVVHYLDDFMLAGKSGTQTCSQFIVDFLELYTDWGVPLTKENTIDPTTLFYFWGLEIEHKIWLSRYPSHSYKALFYKGHFQAVVRVNSPLIFVFSPPVRALIRWFYHVSCGLKQSQHRQCVCCRLTDGLHNTSRINKQRQKCNVSTIYVTRGFRTIHGLTVVRTLVGRENTETLQLTPFLYTIHYSGPAYTKHTV